MPPQSDLLAQGKIKQGATKMTDISLWRFRQTPHRHGQYTLLAFGRALPDWL